MDNKEKLAELLVEFIEVDAWDNGEFIEKNIDFQKIASDLTAHGVTVQEWIPVEDRLPEEGEYVLCVLKGFNYGGKIQVCKFVPADKFKDKPYFEHFRNGFPPVTHWMPLPHPPKGETNNA